MADTATTDRLPTEAEEARTRAEAAKCEAEALKVRAEIARLEAETREAEAKAFEAEARAEKAGFDQDREREKRDKELSADLYHHVYHFKQSVDSGSVDNCMAQLNYWRRSEVDVSEQDKRVEIIFYSPGGSVLAGMALFDFITEMRREGWYFTTNCRGYAASMAGILLQAGDHRVCGPESYILIHEVSSMAVGKVGELEDEVEFVKLIQKRVLDIFVKRSGGKVTAAKLQSKFRRKDFWLDSAEALKLGIVDEVR